MKTTQSYEKIPGPPSLPLIGSAPWILHREGPLQGFLALAEKYRAEGIFGIVTPSGLSQIFVCNAALAQHLFDEENFQKAIQGPLVRVRDFGGDGLFTADTNDESWGRAHRILSPGFTAESMERYFPSMRQITEELLINWRASSEPVDVVKDMTRLTLDTISLCGFGKDFQSFHSPTLHPFLRSIGRVLQEATDELGRPAALSFLFSGKRERFSADVALMFSGVDEVIAARKKLPSAEWPKDFLSLMLSEKDPKTGELLSDENIRYQVITFLIAGHETTAGLLSFMLHQLAFNAPLQQRVFEEVIQAFGDGEPTRAGVLRLSLVMRCFSEALRLWPTVPVLSFASSQDALIGEWEFPKGIPLNVLVSALHRDPAAWKDPTRFDPDRFLPEEVRSRPAASYKPFGNGRRSCTGRIFALLEAALALAMIVREFTFSTDNKLRIAPTLSPKPAGLRLLLQRRARVM
jgi:cytochrome P450 / NADPH-cytochrome P450 reductase